MGKIVDKLVFKTQIRPKLKKEGKQIALCHGVFDLVHPGHIIHLQQAKQMAGLSDGVIVGSAIVRLLKEHGKEAPEYIGEYVRRMKEAIRQ